MFVNCASAIYNFPPGIVTTEVVFVNAVETTRNQIVTNVVTVTLASPSVKNVIATPMER